MIPAIVAMVLAGTPRTYAAQPNRFEPKQMSSEAIYVGVRACMEDASRNRIPEPRSVVFCGCLMDAVRSNSGGNATDEQRKVCDNATSPKVGR